jgi:outer membrane receptor protein involved in Fe transport
MQTNTTGAFRRRSALALALAPILSSGLALGAHAQTAAPDAPQASADDPGETIIVTALKTSQRLIDVPAPVSAISASTLTQQNLPASATISTACPVCNIPARRCVACRCAALPPAAPPIPRSPCW